MMDLFESILFLEKQIMLSEQHVSPYEIVKYHIVDLLFMQNV